MKLNCAKFISLFFVLLMVISVISLFNVPSVKGAGSVVINPSTVLLSLANTVTLNDRAGSGAGQLLNGDNNYLTSIVVTLNRTSNCISTDSLEAFLFYGDITDTPYYSVGVPQNTTYIEKSYSSIAINTLSVTATDCTFYFSGLTKLNNGTQYMIGIVQNGTLGEVITGYWSINGYHHTGLSGQTEKYNYEHIWDTQYLIDYSNCMYIIENTAFNYETDRTFQGVLNGDIFVNAILAEHPTAITLKQGVQYSFSGEYTVNSSFGNHGSYTISLSALFSSDVVFNIFQPVMINYQTSGTYDNGTFSFIIFPRSSPINLYQVLQVNIISSENISYTATYDLVFYALGTVNNPTIGAGGGGGGVITGQSPFSTNFIMLLLFFLIIVIPFGLYFGNYGLYFGLIFATIITYMAGFMPIWGLFLLVIGLGLMGYQVFSGMIPQTLPQVPEIPHFRKNDKVVRE